MIRKLICGFSLGGAAVASVWIITIRSPLPIKAEKDTAWTTNVYPETGLQVAVPDWANVAYGSGVLSMTGFPLVARPEVSENFGATIAMYPNELRIHKRLHPVDDGATAGRAWFLAQHLDTSSCLADKGLYFRRDLIASNTVYNCTGLVRRFGDKRELVVYHDKFYRKVGDDMKRIFDSIRAITNAVPKLPKSPNGEPSP